MQVVIVPVTPFQQNCSIVWCEETMQAAIDEWMSFDEAYEATDWTDFIEFPAFIEANRRNAYAVFLALEQESLE